MTVTDGNVLCLDRTRVRVPVVRICQRPPLGELGKGTGVSLYYFLQQRLHYNYLDMKSLV